MAAPTIDETVVSGLEFGVSTKAVTFSGTPSDGKGIMLVYVQTAASAASRTWPAGFVEKFHEQSVGLDTSISVATKIASGEGSDTYTLTLGDSGDNNQQMRGFLISGVDPDEIVNAISSTIAGEDGFWNNEVLNFTGITTTRADTLLLWLCGNSDNASTGLSATGFTFDESGSSGDRIPWGQKNLNPVGATGTIGITEDAAAGHVAAAIGIFVAIQGPPIAVTDDFNRANGDLDDGTVWIDAPHAAAHLEISSNHVIPDAGGADSGAYYSNGLTFAAAQYSEADISITSDNANGEGMGLTVRQTGDGTLGGRYFFRVVIQNGTSNLEIAKRVAGTYTSLQVTTVSFTTGDRMRVEIDAAHLITVYINGVSVATYDASGAVSGASQLGNGAPGISHSSSTTGAQVDNWGGGDLEVDPDPNNRFDGEPDTYHVLGGNVVLQPSVGNYDPRRKRVRQQWQRGSRESSATITKPFYPVILEAIDEGVVSVTIIGVTATATASGNAGTVAAVRIAAVAGVVATATAAGLIGTVAAQNKKDIAGVVATATADGLAGSVTAQQIKSISGVAATAAADGLAGRRQPPFILAPSTNISASGSNTTGQLTAPGGHSFGGGRIQDDENPTDAVDLGTSQYREDEWNIQATSEAIPGAVYDFRLVVGGNPVESSVTPQWTIGASGSVTIIGVTATATASGNVGVVAAENDKDIVGVTATATADGLAGSVATVRVVSVAGQAASATADGLAGTVAAQVVVTVLGQAATATANGIAGTVVTFRVVLITGITATATADGYAGTILAQRTVTVTGVEATAIATGLAGTVLGVRNTTVIGEVATALADGIAGTVVVFRVVTVSGALATASADGLAGQILIGRTVPGVVATASADGLAGTVIAQRIVAVGGITATATADGLAGIVVTTRFVTVNGIVATATADGYAGVVVAQNVKTISGITATANADGYAGVIAAQRVVTVGGITALADAAGLAGVVLTGGVVSIQGVTATADATGNAGTVVTFRVVSVVGVTATATASGNAGQVQVARAIAGALATANATGLAGILLAQQIVTITGITATANADGLGGAVQSAGNRTILGEAATASASGLAGIVAAQVTVTISGEAASALASGLAGTLVTERYALILGAVATALATGYAGVVVLADGTVIYIEATATLAQEIGTNATLALEVAATASYTDVHAVATRPTDNVEATASNTEALAVASREI